MYLRHPNSYLATCYNLEMLNTTSDKNHKGRASNLQCSPQGRCWAPPSQLYSEALDRAFRWALLGRSETLSLSMVPPLMHCIEMIRTHTCYLLPCAPPTITDCSLWTGETINFPPLDPELPVSGCGTDPGIHDPKGMEQRAHIVRSVFTISKTKT